MYKKLLLPVSIFILVLLMIYIKTTFFPIKTIQLNLTIDEWHSKIITLEENTNNIKSYLLEIKEGKKFGTTKYIASSKNTPFKLLEIIDDSHSMIQFDESLVIVGESIGQPSKHNPIIISTTKTCFRTRSLDAGTDLCLQIVN